MEQDQVKGRFVATCASVGFARPPVSLRIKLLRAAEVGTLFVQPAVDDVLGSVVEWLIPSAPRSVSFGSHRVIRAEYTVLPPKWKSTFEHVGVDLLQLHPDGIATVDVTATRQGIQAFSQRLRVTGEPVEVRQVGPARSSGALLTRPQEEALRAAVAAGYYRIPRPLNLHQLAAMANVTAASLSERLRRAEGRVLTQYVHLGCPVLERTAYGTELPIHTETQETAQGE